MKSAPDTPTGPLRDLIISDEPTVGPGETLDVGLKALACSSCRTVVVADTEGLFCGTFDFTCGLRSRLPEYFELLSDPRVLSFRSDRKLTGVSREDRPLCDFFDHQPITVGETATLTQLTALFVRHRVDAIPVLRGARSVGLVTRNDLIGEVLLTPGPEVR